MRHDRQKSAEFAYNQKVDQLKTARSLVRNLQKNERDLGKQIEERDSTMQKVTRERNRAQSELNKLKSNFEKRLRSAVMQSVKELSKDIAEVQAQLDKSKTKNTRLNAQHGQLNEKYQDLHEKWKEYHIEILAREQQISGEAIKELYAKLADSLAERDQFKNEKEKISQLNQTSDKDWQERFNQYGKQWKAYHDSTIGPKNEELVSKHKELEQAQASNKELEEKIARLQQNSAELRSQNHALHESLIPKEASRKGHSTEEKTILRHTTTITVEGNDESGGSRSSKTAASPTPSPTREDDTARRPPPIDAATLRELGVFAPPNPSASTARPNTWESKVFSYFG